MITFILGKSGTGKTSLCIDEIATHLADSGNSRQLILLVPEQATYQAERSILSRASINGYSRLSVLSFQRLAMTLSGSSLAQATLSRSAKQMIITRLLMEHSDELKVFGSTARKPGTASGITRAISEFQHYSKTPDDIKTLIESFSSDTSFDAARLKFADINLIYSEYLDFIKDSFINPDDNLNIATGAVGRADFLKDSLLWVDGFAGFTASEFQMLIALAKHSSSTRIALCLDPQKIDITYPEIDPTSLFSPTERTYIQLVEAIRQAKIPIERPTILQKTYRFKNATALGHIEENIFSSLPPERIPVDGIIEIIAAHRQRQEVDFVASQICRLVRESNYRWRDIAVISPDIDSYKHYIAAAFGDYNIPFFIDTLRAMNQYPAVELITSALKIASASFETTDVLACLKSDLINVSRDDVDLLENYCLAFGITAGDWTKDSPWNFTGPDDSDFDQTKINDIRHHATDDLFTFAAALSSAQQITAEQFCQLLLDFLEQINLRQTIERWTVIAQESSDNDTAQTHQQFMTKFPQILGELIDVFKDTVMAPADFASVLASAFSQMALALIPPGLDQVLIGSIERSRHPDLKAVFLIGTSQKQFPTPVSFDNILSDPDRLAAESFDFILSDPAQRKLIERRYLAYIAFTRASEHLYISYPLTDSKGSEVQPSGFIEDLQSLFTDLQSRTYYSDISPDKIYSQSALTDILCSAPADSSQAVLKQMEADEKLKDCADFVRASFNFDSPAELSPDFIDSCFDETYHTSSTQLDSFASCPFSYFCRYILRLKKRRLFDLEPLDLGRFYHSVLEKVFEKTKTSAHNFKSCSDETLISILTETVEQLKSTDYFLRSFISHSKHNRCIINSAVRMLSSAILEIAVISRAGAFEQAACELDFGSSESSGPGYTIELDNGRKIAIHGKIDRLDIAKVDGENLALIFDYKLSSKSFNYSNIAAGMGTQLLIYVLAANNFSIDGESVKPVGAFYLPIESRPQTVKRYPTDGDKKISRKPKGFFNGTYYNLIDSKIDSGWSDYYSFGVLKKDETPYRNYVTSSSVKPEDYKLLIDFAELKIKSIACEILSGEIIARPYRQGTKTPCSYCRYKPVCRFDWQIHRYNEIPKITKTALLSGGLC